MSCAPASAGRIRSAPRSLVPRSIVALTFVVAAAACASSAPDLGVERCEPALLEARTGGTLRVEGGGFFPLTAVDFDGPSITAVDGTFVAELVSASRSAELLGVARLDSERLSGRVPPGLEPGLYGLRVRDPRGRTALLGQCVQLAP